MASVMESFSLSELRAIRPAEDRDLAPVHLLVFPIVDTGRLRSAVANSIGPPLNMIFTCVTLIMISNSRRVRPDHRETIGPDLQIACDDADLYF
jgi:hypothetical protein